MRRCRYGRRKSEQPSRGLMIACCPYTSSGDVMWYGLLAEVTPAGARFLLERRFEADTVLRVRLGTAAAGEPALLLARVVRAAGLDGGQWAVDCEFVSDAGHAALVPHFGGGCAAVR